ncbi:MAG: sodium transport system permease protein [Alphaproteobacteria bacterium]|jgi:sodium transport system permease protein
MWLIFKKEILELLRDRKTLFFMIALPLLVFPLIFGGMFYFTGKAMTESQTKDLSFAVSGAQYAPELVAALEGVEGLTLKNVSGNLTDKEIVADAINRSEVDFVLQIPSNYSNNIDQSGQITLKLVLNDAQLNSVRSRIRDITDDVEEANQRSAFANLNISESIQTAMLDPIIIEKVNLADAREQTGAIFGGLIPYFMFILCLQGAMLPAADIGAGEKERGTLETLLLSPVDRHSIVLAKFLTIATAGLTSALVTVLSMGVWAVVISIQMPMGPVVEFISAIDWFDFILVFLMLIPVVATFASLLLALSIYARSFKEAQGYMSPLMIMVFLPIIVTLIPGIELKGVWAWIPLTNVALAIKELVKGTMDYVQLIGIFGSSVILAGALLAFCVYWFKQEKVLFR